MADVLVVNAGSSSLKLSVIDPRDTVTAEHTVDLWDGSPAAAGLRPFLEGRTGIGAVGHRVVHGFHGLSHGYAARRAAELTGRSPADGLRVVTCHLGAGSSLAAVHGGQQR